jgi:phage protein D
MDLQALASTHGEFYAPAFALRIGVADLVRDLLIPVSQVEADLELGKTGAFSFTVADAYDIEHGGFVTGTGRPLLPLLDFGTEIDLCMGYGDAGGLPAVISGVVTSLSTSFPDGGMPELVVEGRDHSFPLTNGKNSRAWTKARDSDAVAEIAGYYNLAANIEPTSEQHEQIEQNQESDFEFLLKLAKRNKFELFVDELRALHFHRPGYDRADVVRLDWGKGLLSFKPEANLGGQVSLVEVRGWDPRRKETILGTARAGEESGAGGGSRSAGERINAFVRDPSKQPALRLRQPVFTQSEANQRAKALLNERAENFLTGDAESIGLPEIRPDRNVLLGNLGRPFSKTYYVQQATHKIDANGYRTRFKVKETRL